MDANTGHFAAYGIGWKTGMAAQGAPQTGPLFLLDKGTARTLAIRPGAKK
jgi:hypothetical protein